MLAVCERSKGRRFDRFPKFHKSRWGAYGLRMARVMERRRDAGFHTIDEGSSLLLIDSVVRACMRVVPVYGLSAP